MQVYYMIDKCDNLFSLGRAGITGLSCASGVFLHLPYKEASLTIFIALMAITGAIIHKKYLRYKIEIDNLPEKTKKRVEFAIQKHHHNQVWWRWSFLAIVVASVSCLITTGANLFLSNFL